MILKQSTAVRRWFFIEGYTSTSTLSLGSSISLSPTGLTGLTIAFTLAKDGGGFGNPNVGASNLTEDADGWYYFDLDTTDTNTLGPLKYKLSWSGGANDCGEQDQVFVGTLDALPTALPGTPNGLIVLGTNDTGTTTTLGNVVVQGLQMQLLRITGGVNITLSGGTDPTVQIQGRLSSAIRIIGGTDSEAVNLAGSGVGPGLVIAGGLTGKGLYISGGSTSGDAVYITSIDGDGIKFSPGGSGKVDINATKVANLLAQLFTEDTGKVHSDVVAGSVIKELEDNSINLASLFTTDSGETYGSSVSGSVVKEIANHANLITILGSGVTPQGLNAVYASLYGNGIDVVSISVDNSTTSPTTTVFETTDTFNADRFTDQVLLWSSGTNRGIFSRVASYAYTVNNKVQLTLSSALPTTPVANDTFVIFGRVEAGGGGSGLDAAGVRAAVGLASANLDTQLAEIEGETDGIATIISTLGAPVVSVSDDIAAVDTEVDTLLSRLTASRAGYFDNLNVGGLVASSAEATAIQNNTRVVRVVPEFIELPASSTRTYRVELFLYDETNNMEAPDSAPTIALVNQSGTDRSGRLDSVTMILVSTGRYRAIYTSTAGDTKEQLNWTFTVIEGGNTRVYGNTSDITDAIATDFTSSDRTMLVAAYNKLPSANYLAGTSSSSGADAQVDVTKVRGTASAGDVGYIGVDWGHMTNPTAANTLSGTKTDLVNAPNATALTAFANALLDLIDGIETGTTPRKALRAIAAALAGESTKTGSSAPFTVTFFGIGVDTQRLQATVDDNNQRTDVTLSL